MAQVYVHKHRLKMRFKNFISRGRTGGEGGGGLVPVPTTGRAWSSLPILVRRTDGLKGNDLQRTQVFYQAMFF